MKIYVPTMLAILALVGLNVASAAPLESRIGGEAWYDPDRDLTWLADADHVGGLFWSIAQSKISELNRQSYLGSTTWRLPTTTLPDPTCANTANNGANCTGSEMGHLFYEVLGGVANTSVEIAHGSQFSNFKNVVAGSYWSGTENLAFPGPISFSFLAGTQDISNNYDTQYHSWLVMSGDIAAVPVPPQTPMLVIAMALVARWRRRPIAKGRAA